MSKYSPYGDSRSLKAPRVDTSAHVHAQHDAVTSTAQHAFFHSVSADVVAEMVRSMRVSEALALHRCSKWMRRCVVRSLELHNRTVILPTSLSTRARRGFDKNIASLVKYENLLRGRLLGVLAYDNVRDEYLDAAGIGTPPQPLAVECDDLFQPRILRSPSRIQSLRCTRPINIDRLDPRLGMTICEAFPSLTELHLVSAMTFPNLALLGARAHNLTSLSCCVYKIHRGDNLRSNWKETLYLGTSPCFPKLERLRMSDQMFYDGFDHYMHIYKEVFPSTLLSLSLRTGHLSQGHLAALLHSFQDLTELDLGNCSGAGTEDLRSISDLPKLQRLTSGKSLCDLKHLTPFRSPDMRELHFRFYHYCGDGEILRSRGPSAHDSAASTMLLEQFLPRNLRAVVLTGPTMNPATIMSLYKGPLAAPACIALLEASFHRLASVERLGLLNMTLSRRVCAQFGELRRLRKLELSQLEGRGIFPAAMALPPVTDHDERDPVGAHHIAALALSKTPLEVLNIQHCCDAEEETVSFLKHLLKLKTLNYLFWTMESTESCSTDHVRSSSTVPKFVRPPVNPRVCVLNEDVCHTRAAFKTGWQEYQEYRMSKKNEFDPIGQ